MPQRRRTNRITINVEDEVYTAISELADREFQTLSNICRDFIVSELVRLELLPEQSIRRLAGIRE